MSQFTKPGDAKFGEVCGVTEIGVVAYSNGDDMVFSGERSYFDGILTGFKWQCVEFARRYLLASKGLYLPDVPWAAMVFEKDSVVDAVTNESVKMVANKNNGEVKPVADSLLIYPSMDDYPPGHIAAIVEVGDNFVRIADQNNKFHKWADGKKYSDELELTFTDGKWLMKDSLGRIPLGFMTFPDRPSLPKDAPELQVHAELKAPTVHEPMSMIRKTFVPEKAPGKWLDEEDPAEKQFIKTFGMDLSRTRLEEAEANYYEINPETWFACTQAGHDLHRMFIAATERVLKDDALLERFGIPKSIWGRMKRSFESNPYAISGRFDFALTGDGKTLKTFEYNADSASTLLECGVIQEKWANSVGLGERGRSSGWRIGQLLPYAWYNVIKAGVLQKGQFIDFCVDNDDEEQYTALYVLDGAKKAGLDGKLHILFDDFEWRGGAVVEKGTGRKVTAVWKTWAWETAISDLAAAEAERGADWKPKDGDAVRLSDILLGDESIMVYEPIWKLIPSNKAILPLLWEMYPNHPNLLRTEWTVTEELKKTGYAKKPIVGRTGQNVTIVRADGSEAAASEGKFSERDYVYQELFDLPKRDDYFAILGGWMLGPNYGGTGIREDKSIITNVESPFSAIRVVFDDKVKKDMEKAREAAQLHKEEHGTE